MQSKKQDVYNIVKEKTTFEELSVLVQFYLQANDQVSAQIALERAKELIGLADVDVQVSEGTPPSIRYQSGSTVYDEALLQGRWVCRYWSSDGKTLSECHVQEPLNDTMVTLPLHTFCLEMDGQSLHTHWEWQGATVKLEQDLGCIHIIVKLRHQIRPVEVAIHTRLDGTPFLARWLTVTNTADRPAALSSVASWSGPLWTKKYTGYYLQEKPAHPFHLGYYASSLSHWEGDFAWKPLENGTVKIAGRRGHSGYGLPFFIVRNTTTGEHFVGHLAWTGNWAVEFLCDAEPHGEEANLIFRAGPDGFAPQRILAAGESVDTPEVHLAPIHGDLDACVQASHNHLRHSVIPLPQGDRAFLVQYNTLNEAGNYYGNKECYPEYLREQADLAAEIGSELFIIDSGWYGKQVTHGSWGIAGDWHPNDWLGKGLQETREYVRSKGMLFGLYAEMETIGFDSDLYANHPDWVLMRDGKRATGWQRDKRGLLDLTRPEVAEWMERDIARLIQEYDLDLFRLDANVRYLFEGGQRIADGFVESTFWRYYETLYAIWERIRRRFPHVILQQASSGGCRNDIGILSRFHEAFLTDGTHLPRQLHVHNGLAVALPPEIFRTGAGLTWPPSEPRGSLETQLRTSILLTPPMLVDVAVAPPGSKHLPPSRIAIFRRYVDLYKEVVRPILRSECRVFHHLPITDTEVRNDWFVIEYADPAGRAAVLLIIRLEGADSASLTVHPKGVRRSATYSVTFDNSRDAITMTGMEAGRGITAHVGQLYESELLIFTEVNH